MIARVLTSRCAVLITSVGSVRGRNVASEIAQSWLAGFDSMMGSRRSVLTKNRAASGRSREKRCACLAGLCAGRTDVVARGVRPGCGVRAHRPGGRHRARRPRRARSELQAPPTGHWRGVASCASEPAKALARRGVPRDAANPLPRQRLQRSPRGVRTTARTGTSSARRSFHAASFNELGELEDPGDSAHGSILKDDTDIR